MGRYHSRMLTGNSSVFVFSWPQTLLYRLWKENVLEGQRTGFILLHSICIKPARVTVQPVWARKSSSTEDHSRTQGPCHCPSHLLVYCASTFSQFYHHHDMQILGRWYLKSHRTGLLSGQIAEPPQLLGAYGTLGIWTHDHILENLQGRCSQPLGHSSRLHISFSFFFFFFNVEKSSKRKPILLHSCDQEGCHYQHKPD